MVLLGDNHLCKTIGVGSVKFKIFDGVIRTLTDVRHVPKLKKIKIIWSIGFLWSQFYRFLWNSKSFQGCFSGHEGTEDKKPLQTGWKNAS